MKALVVAFNQEKALVGAFSVLVKTDCETNGSFHSTIYNKSERGKISTPACAAVHVQGGPGQ